MLELLYENQNLLSYFCGELFEGLAFGGVLAGAINSYYGKENLRNKINEAFSSPLEKLFGFS